MISSVSVFLRKLRRTLSRSYLAARLFGRKMPEGEAEQPGLIMLQVDGLSRQQLERALVQGNMPFLSNLIRRRHFDLETFYSGMPSTTPAVQAEIFYQVRQAVPAFEFYHKRFDRIVRMYEAETASEVESGLRQDGAEPLLEGGHAYSNVYRGGAALTRYCSQDLAPRTLLRRIHPLKSLILGIVYIPKILRLIALTLFEILLAVIDFAKGLYQRKDFLKEFEFIFSRIAISIGLREMIRFRALLDIESGIRLVHANFLGYDEQAHRRGPDSAFAHWTLKGIDRAIRDIQRAAHRSPYLDYELIIYSDHGQEATVPFQKSRGRSLESAVAEAFSGGPLADLPVHCGTNAEMLTRTLGRKRNLAELGSEAPKDTNGAKPGNEIILCAMGPTGQLYLPRPLDREAIQGYAKALVQVGGIPLVCWPESEGRALAFNAGGQWRLPEDRARVFGQSHPFLDEVAEDTIALCHSPHAGDLMLSGWDPEQRPLSFRVENGAHGGPGAEETRGFLLLSDRIHRWHRAHLPRTRDRVRGEELHSIARHFLHRSGSEEAERVPERKPEREPGPLKLRVMTYNVHSCKGMDGKVRAERVARVINEFDPDVVAIQEIDAHRPRTDRQDQPGRIAAHLRMEHAFHAMLEEAEERYGIAVFSRFPFEMIRSDLLSPAESRREARGAIWLRILPGGKTPFHFINTHFGLGRGERHRQCQTLLGSDWLGAVPEDEPLVLCGDFNSSPRSKVYRNFDAHLTDVWRTPGVGPPRPGFPSMAPFLRLDHIFASDHFGVDRVEILQSWNAAVASDHLPLCAELTLPPAKAHADT